MIYLSTAQVSDRYSISRTTIWRWVRSGRLPKPVLIGPGVKRFRTADLDAADLRFEASEGVSS